MKKTLALLIICLSTILVGCVNTDLTVDIDKSGNATMSIKLLTSDYLGSAITEEDLGDFEADTIEEISESGQSGYLLIKNLGNLKDITSSDNDYITNNELIDIAEEKGLIFNIYDVNLKIRDIVLGDMTQDDMAMLNFIGNSANMNFHVKTPFEFLESNATSIVEGEDRRVTYSWNYNLNSLDNIHIKFKVPNVINICIILGAVIALGIGGFIFIKRRKNEEA